MTKNNAKWAVQVLENGTWKTIAVNGPMVCLRFSLKYVAVTVASNLRKADPAKKFRVRNMWVA